MGNAYTTFFGKTEEKRPFGNVNVRIILK